mmetsp:Transcript_29998/g.68126  ORF Transcript_29998/g.68126 Transcript_29998/m.68126 type:complete len:326 (-) Transcript_29998:803-1780(-)
MPSSRELLPAPVQPTTPHNPPEQLISETETTKGAGVTHWWAMLEPCSCCCQPPPDDVMPPMPPSSPCPSSSSSSAFTLLLLFLVILLMLALQLARCNCTVVPQYHTVAGRCRAALVTPTPPATFVLFVPIVPLVPLKSDPTPVPAWPHPSGAKGSRTSRWVPPCALSTRPSRLRLTLASMTPLITQGRAFMGKMSMFSSASAVITSAALKSMWRSTQVVKVTKGTSTGVDAHRNTHSESRYLRCERNPSSVSRSFELVLSTAPSIPPIFRLIILRSASVNSLMRASLAAIREAVEEPISFAINELSGIITRITTNPARNPILMLR